MWFWVEGEVKVVVPLSPPTPLAHRQVFEPRDSLLGNATFANFAAGRLGANPNANTKPQDSLLGNATFANFAAGRLGVNPNANYPSSLVNSFSSQQRTPSLAAMHDMQLLLQVPCAPTRTHAFIRVLVYTFVKPRRRLPIPLYRLL